MRRVEGYPSRPSERASERVTDGKTEQTLVSGLTSSVV